MIPTRTEIATKIDELIEDSTKNKEDYYDEIAAWLDQMECPEEDKKKILDDLTSYPNY